MKNNKLTVIFAFLIGVFLMMLISSHRETRQYKHEKKILIKERSIIEENNHVLNDQINVKDLVIDSLTSIVDSFKVEIRKSKINYNAIKRKYRQKRIDAVNTPVNFKYDVLSKLQ